MAWTIVAHIGAMSADGASVTTPAIDTRNADLIILGCTTAAGTTASPTDSKSNVWTAIQQVNNGTGVRGTLLYKAVPTTDAAHTFTLSPGANNFPVIFVLAVSGSKTSPLDQNNGTAATNSANQQPGSITPLAAGELIVTFNTNGSVSNNATYTIDSSFTISDQKTGEASHAFAGAMAYLIQAVAAAVNPTWTIANPLQSNNACLIASFQALITGGYNIQQLYA